MIQIAMLGMLFHVVAYPVSFMPLSKGDSLTFIVQETIYNTAFVLLVVYGYSCFGLLGLGAAMFVLRVLDFAVVCLIARVKYGFMFSQRVIMSFLFEILLFAAVLCSVLLSGNSMVSWSVGICAVSISAIASLYMLSHHNDLFNKIFKRLLRRR